MNVRRKGRFSVRLAVVPSSRIAETSQLERLSAAHLPWLRGARADVEALVASSSDRALTAKLEALRRRAK